MHEEHVYVLDTRKGTDFTQGFVPGSVNIGLEGRFAEWAGVVLPIDAPVLLVCDEGTETEAVSKLERIGFSNIRGHLDGGFESWKTAGETVDLIIDVEADELAMDIPFDDNLVIVDVRRETEFGDGHVANAVNIPLDEFTDIVTIADFEEFQNIYVHCGSGYRSVTAVSLLKRQGFHNIRNVLGGFEQIKEQKTINIIRENSVLN